MNWLFIFAGIVLVYLSLCIRVVRPPYKWVVEYWGGEEIRVWGPGIHLLLIPIPIFMRVANKLRCDDEVITLRIGESEGEGGTGRIDFKDAAAAVEVQVILRVTDPEKATYNVNNYRMACLNRIESEIREHFSSMELDDAIQSKGEVASRIFEEFNGLSPASEETHGHGVGDTESPSARWGAILSNPGNEISIMDFNLDPELEKQRQKILNAEKDAEAEVRKAEGDKSATILRKEGEAKGIELVKRAEGKGIEVIENAKGKGEVKKISFIAKKLGLANEQVQTYLLTGQLFDAMKSATIVATSEGGILNAPVNVAATMSAIQSSMPESKAKGAA